ncbi:MAG: type II secretion system protein GspL, partial [Dokdonella sp.]
MSDRLLLRLASDGRLSWLRQTADGRVLGASQDGAPDKAELTAASEIVVLVPAEDVLLASASVPARNRSQQLQAVPFALEDQLIGAVEDLHFAVAAGAGDDVSVAVVAQARLREWLAQLQTAGIQPDVLLPETL